MTGGSTAGQLSLDSGDRLKVVDGLVVIELGRHVRGVSRRL